MSGWNLLIIKDLQDGGAGFCPDLSGRYLQKECGTRNAERGTETIGHPRKTRKDAKRECFKPRIARINADSDLDWTFRAMPTLIMR